MRCGFDIQGESMCYLVGKLETIQGIIPQMADETEYPNGREPNQSSGLRTCRFLSLVHIHWALPKAAKEVQFLAELWGNVSLGKETLSSRTQICMVSEQAREGIEAILNGHTQKTAVFA